MPDDDLTRLATAMLDTRRLRLDHFPASLLVGEQVWNLLLILFIADGHGRRLTGRMAIEQEGGSHEVGRRWIQHLTRLGYLIGDGEGHLDDTLTMTPLCLHLLETWLVHVRAALRPIMVDAPRP